MYTDKNADSIKSYLDAMLEELTIYANKPFIGGRKPSFVYFGGGTPSYLSSSQLFHLTDGMKGLLPWDEVKEVTFECEPGTLTDKKLKTLHEVGVTRLSLGVENFVSPALTHFWFFQECTIYVSAGRLLMEASLHAAMHPYNIFVEVWVSSLAKVLLRIKISTAPLEVPVA